MVVLHGAGVEEERDVTHDAYLLAFEAAKPSAMRVPGLQEFAAALWARRRYSTSGDPLHHLFKEYDADNDGKLKADEIAAAFASHNVSISAEQVKALIATYVTDSETCDTDPDSAPATDTISAQMWPEWIHSLAISELHSRGACPLGLWREVLTAFRGCSAGAIAPVVDASSSQSRADVLAIIMSAVLLLTGLQWLSLKPKVVPSAWPWELPRHIAPAPSQPPCTELGGSSIDLTQRAPKYYTIDVCCLLLKFS
ncbi:hypothetical protein V8C86DRAFT_2436260 [Haematococcus lacustris]